MDRTGTERQSRGQSEGPGVAQPVGAVNEGRMLAAPIAFEMQPPDLDLLLIECDNGFRHQNAFPSSLSWPLEGRIAMRVTGLRPRPIRLGKLA